MRHVHPFVAARALAAFPFAARADLASPVIGTAPAATRLDRLGIHLAWLARRFWRGFDPGP